jgi:hypothetical protein
MEYSVVSNKNCITCSSIDSWVYNNGKYNAQGYAKKLMKPENLGCAQECEKGQVTWNNPVMNLSRISVRDENVRHTSDTNGEIHMDYVYSHTVLNNINKIHVRILSEVINNFKVNLITKEVIVRCHSILNNQVALGFIDDLSSNRLDYNIYKLKHEYKKRSRNHTTNANFPDIMNERTHNEIIWDLRTRL